MRSRSQVYGLAATAVVGDGDGSGEGQGGVKNRISSARGPLLAIKATLYRMCIEVVFSPQPYSLVALTPHNALETSIY